MPPDAATLSALRIQRHTAPKPELPRWLIPALLVLLLCGGLAAWYLSRPQPIAVETVEVRALQKSTAQSSSGSSRTLLNASGYVTARRAATVSSKVTGKVKEVMIEEGKEVKEGDTLATLDASNVEASTRLAEAQLESAQAMLEETAPNLAFAQREWKRFIDLAATRAVSDSDLRRTEAEAKALSARVIRQRAEVAVAEREVAQWRQQLDDTIIRAPFSGIVTSKNAQPGEMISPMSVGGFTRTGICTIVDMASLEIEVDVNESYINRVQPGQPVESTLNAYPEWRIAGKVIAVIPTADRQKATVKVRVGLDATDARILPDMGAKVAFLAPAEEKHGATSAGASIIVPAAAVQEASGRSIAWVVRDGKVERRAISTGAPQNGEILVSAGLNPGERVVINAPAALADGSRVKEKKP